MLCQSEVVVFRCSDSESHAVDFGFHVSATWILDSNREWDSEFLELYSGLQSPGLRIPQAKISWIPDFARKTFSKIPDSGFPYMGRHEGSTVSRVAKPDQEKNLNQLRKGVTA